MQKKIMEMIQEYKSLEDVLFKQMLKTWDDDVIDAYHNVLAKLEVLEYLLYYDLEEQLNG